MTSCRDLAVAHQDVDQDRRRDGIMPQVSGLIQRRRWRIAMERRRVSVNLKMSHPLQVFLCLAVVDLDGGIEGKGTWSAWFDDQILELIAVPVARLGVLVRINGALILISWIGFGYIWHCLEHIDIK